MNYIKFNKIIDLAKIMIPVNVYRSSILEGVKANYNQVKEVLKNGKCRNLSPNDVTIIINLKRAWEFLLDKENLNRNVDFALMQDLHQILGRVIDTLRWNEIGKFRID